MTWIHFGANIGVADGKPSLRSASDDLRQLTEAELVRAGGRCVTLVRSNLLFHLPQERWPHTVDMDAVARVVAATIALVFKLTR